MASEYFLPTDKLSKVIERDYRLMQVVARFDITMGFADKTISEVCHQHGVDVHTFLAVVNLVGNYQTSTPHSIQLDLVNVSALLEYLKHTHDYLINHQLPRMRRDLLGAMDCSLQNEIAFLLLKYFDMYVSEVQKHVTFEESQVYAYAQRLLQGHPTDELKMPLHKHNEDFVDNLHELINVFLQYYPQQGKNLALNDVLYNIYRIEEDINIHCMIEDEMLVPLIKKLERKSSRLAKAQVSSDDRESSSSSSASKLSEREQSIAICVAKGLSNKEIADQLNLSLNTVTTHRRNIAHKLDIHSSAGIAIYCVVNKLVKLEEINL